MSVFRDDEIEYLTGERRLARIATVGLDGVPHVTPVGYRYDASTDAIEIGGLDLVTTKKYRDVERSRSAAVVVDDLASVDPWHPRGIEVRGVADAIADPEPVIRIRPSR